MSESKVLNMDCMDFMRTVPDGFFELACIDPPYRDKNQPTKDMREKGGKMDGFGKKPDALYFKELFRISQNQIVWGGNNFIEHLHNTNCFIFWDKSQPLPNFSDGELAWTSFDSVARKFDYPIHKHNLIDKIHPTEKPVALYDWIFKNYAKPGDKILDTHLGSQSSRIAAHRAGLDFTGIELDKYYFDDGCKRFQNFIAQQRLFA